MSDNFKIEDVEVETTETRKKYSKDEDKIETISIPIIQTPDYKYWASQDTIDAKVWVRNISSSIQFASLEMSGSQTIPSATQTQITSFDTSGSYWSALTVSGQTIVVNTTWRYQISYGGFMWDSTTWVRNFDLVVNWTINMIIRAYKDSNWFCNTMSSYVDNFNAWDIVRLDVYQNAWINQTAQKMRLSLIYLG